MKMSMFVTAAVLFVASAAQPSGWSAQGLESGQILPCASQKTNANALQEIEKPLAELIGNGNTISIVALGSDQADFSITATINSLGVPNRGCSSSYEVASSL